VSPPLPWLRWAIVCAIASGPAAAKTFSGKVTSVSDGRTVIVTREKDGREMTVRLVALTAPEPDDRFFRDSKENLSRLVLEKTVTVDWFPTSRQTASEMIVGRVLYHSDDVGLLQIAAGFAYHDRAQLADQSTCDRTQYAEAEEKAKENRLGFWGSLSQLVPQRTPGGK
jgi:endonuclease YncB( thermonuclease family)